MIVSENRCRGWVPSRQRNASSATTRLRGTLAAESPALGGPVPVSLALPGPRHEGVPDASVVVPQRNLRFRACFVEQAQHHAAGAAGGHREVRAPVAGGG